MNIKQIIFSGPAWLRHVARLGVGFSSGSSSFDFEANSKSNGSERSEVHLMETPTERVGCSSSINTRTTNMFRMGKTTGGMDGSTSIGMDVAGTAESNPFSDTESNRKSRVSAVRVVRNDLTEEDIEVVSRDGKLFFSGWLGWSLGKGKENPFSKNR